MKTSFAAALALALGLGQVPCVSAQSPVPLSLPSPATGQSARTTTFIADVAAAIETLSGTSRLAEAHAGHAAVQAFARSELAEQSVARGALSTWVRTNTAARAVGAVATPEGMLPLAGAAAAPAVATGRSVAVDVPPPGSSATDSVVPTLSALRGHDFDVGFADVQKRTLSTLERLYADYIERGDDLTLRDLALGELPKVRARLAGLATL